MDTVGDSAKRETICFMLARSTKCESIPGAVAARSLPLTSRAPSRGGGRRPTACRSASLAASAGVRSIGDPSASRGSTCCPPRVCFPRSPGSRLNALPAPGSVRDHRDCARSPGSRPVLEPPPCGSRCQVLSSPTQWHRDACRSLQRADAPPRCCWVPHVGAAALATGARGPALAVVRRLGRQAPRTDARWAGPIQRRTAPDTAAMPSTTRHMPAPLRTAAGAWACPRLEQGPANLQTTLSTGPRRPHGRARNRRDSPRAQLRTPPVATRARPRHGH
jgi:hypothetical protein